VPADALAGVDAINLAGEPVAGERWSDERSA
jgi:NAD dependent epimerase/dehydratase family enzyme